MSKIKPFEKWNEEEIRNTFGLQRVQQIPFLTKWLAAKHNPSINEQIIMEDLRLRLVEMLMAWNEDELKYYFISQLIFLIKCWGKGYNSFNQRILQTRVNGVDMRGRVEVIVASGEHTPKHPYFFIHEYKPTSKGSNDPIGQLLAAMVTAQALNKTDKYLLGCAVIGNQWQFIVLEDNKYAISNGYLATDPEQLLKIYSALIEVKLYVEKQINGDNYPK